MSMHSAAVVSVKEDVLAEAVTKVVTLDVETEDAGTVGKTANAEDLAVVTETAERTQVPVKAEDAAEMRTVRMKGNGAVAIKRHQTVSFPVTEKNGNAGNVRRRKNPVSATVSLRERNNSLKSYQ